MPGTDPKDWTPEQYAKAMEVRDALAKSGHSRGVKDRLEQGIEAYDTARLQVEGGGPLPDGIPEDNASPSADEGDVPEASVGGYPTPDEMDTKVGKGVSKAPITTTDSFLKGAQDEATLGTNDAAAGVGGAAAGIMQRLLGNGFDRAAGRGLSAPVDTSQGALGPDYVNSRQVERDATSEAQAANPKAFFGGQLVGGIAPGILTGGETTAEQAVAHSAKPLLQRIGASAVSGAAQGLPLGAASGFGHSTDAPVTDTLQGAGAGLVGGGLVGGGLEAILSPMRALGSRIWKGMKSDPVTGPTARQAEAAGAQPVATGAEGGVAPGPKVGAILDEAAAVGPDGMSMSTRHPVELAASKAAPEIVETVSNDRAAMGGRIKNAKDVTYDSYPKPVDTEALRAGIEDIGNQDFFAHPTSEGDPAMRPFNKVEMSGKQAAGLPEQITARELDEKWIRPLRKKADPSTNPTTPSDEREYYQALYQQALDFRRKNFPELADVSEKAGKEIGNFEANATAAGLPKGQKKYDPNPIGSDVRSVEQKLRSMGAEGGKSTEDALRTLLGEDKELLDKVRTVQGTAAFKAMRGDSDVKMTLGPMGNLHAFGRLDSLKTRAAGMKNLGPSKASSGATGAVAGSITDDDIEALQYYLQQRKELREGLQQ